MCALAMPIKTTILSLGMLTQSMFMKNELILF